MYEVMNNNMIVNIIHNLPVPTSEPNLETFSEKFWFNDMMYAHKQSDMRWQLGLLAVCPFSGLLMYMLPQWSVGWHIMENIKPNEAYRNYLLERDILNG